MKKFNFLKTLQLIIFIILTAVCLIVIFTNKELFHLIAQNEHVKFICAMLWLALGISFLFTFLDFNFFSSFKRDYSELDFAVHSDPVAGIANRYSCDVLIEKYLDKPLPENLGCVMLELSNIAETNQLYGHLQGNTLIHDFSNILKMTAIDLCFVGRNGGNKFLAIFEETTEEKIETFLARVEQKVKAHNETPDNLLIQYCCGIAFHEDASVNDITRLIALSNQRIGKDTQPQIGKDASDSNDAPKEE